MRIDLTPSPGQPQFTKAELDQLSSQMAAVLHGTKLSLGKSVLLQVGNTSPVSEQEKQLLIQERGQQSGQKALLSVLEKPNVQLIELKLHSHLIYVLSNVSLTKGQSLLVSVSPEGLVPAKPAIPSEGAARHPTDPLTQPGKGSASQASLESKPPPGTVTVASATASAKSVSPPLSSASAIAGEATTNARSTKNLALLQATDSQFTPVRTSEPNLGAQAKRLASPALNELKALVQNGLRAALPTAEPLAKIQLAGKPLLEQLSKLNNFDTRSAGTIALTLSRHLQSLTAFTLVVKPGTPPALEAIEQIIKSSGIFHEAQAKDERKTLSLEATNTKELLLQTAALVSQLQTNSSSVQQSQPGALDKLFMNLFGKTAEQQATNANNNSTNALHNLQLFTQKALAQIQMRQLQTVANMLQEPQSLFQQTLSLDIPLRLPDGWFNLMLSIQDLLPRKSDAKKKRTQATLRKRWKLFMSLDLGECGELASELFVGEKSFDATLWSDNLSLRKTAKTQIEQLRQDLQNQGLEVGEIIFSDAAPPKLSPPAIAPLVDIET